MPLVHDARANNVPVEKLGNLLQRASRDVGVVHSQVHRVGLGMRIISFCVFQQFVFFLKLNFTNELYSEGGSDNTQNA